MEISISISTSIAKIESIFDISILLYIRVLDNVLTEDSYMFNLLE